MYLPFGSDVLSEILIFFLNRIYGTCFSFTFHFIIRNVKQENEINTVLKDSDFEYEPERSTDDIGVIDVS